MARNVSRSGQATTSFVTSASTNLRLTRRVKISDKEPKCAAQRCHMPNISLANLYPSYTKTMRPIQPENETPPENPVAKKASGRVRRVHHKTRTGCRACKARRVKCDELRPSCGSCLKRDSQCEYFDTLLSSNLHPDRVHSLSPVEVPAFPGKALVERTRLGEAQIRTHRQKLDLPVPALDDRLTHGLDVTLVRAPSTQLNLRLFNHYRAMAHSSMKLQFTWCTWVARQALQNPEVMDALLGFSAFHLRQRSDIDPAVRVASHKYMDRAIRSHKTQLKSNINKVNAPAIMASCSLIVMHGSVNQTFVRAKNEHQLPIHWFRPIQAVKALFLQILPCIQDTEVYATIFNLPSKPEILSQGGALTTFNFLLQDMDEQVDEQTLSAYIEAVNHLSFIYSYPDIGRPLRFPIMVPPHFVDLLEAKDPRTLTIVGYFFMVLEMGHLLWWVDGAPAREFAAIMSFLPRSWWPKMDWAIRVLKWEESPSHKGSEKKESERNLIPC